MYWKIVLYLLIAVVGGIWAVYKKDYFTRGFFISFITGIFGVIAIALSPESKAKENNEVDGHYWPQHGSYAVLATFLTIGLVALVYLII